MFDFGQLLIVGFGFRLIQELIGGLGDIKIFLGMFGQEKAPFLTFGQLEASQAAILDLAFLGGRGQNDITDPDLAWRLLSKNRSLHGYDGDLIRNLADARDLKERRRIKQIRL